MLTQVIVKLQDKDKRDDDKHIQKTQMMTYQGLKSILTVHLYESQKYWKTVSTCWKKELLIYSYISRETIFQEWK